MLTSVWRFASSLWTLGRARLGRVPRSFLAYPCFELLAVSISRRFANVDYILWHHREIMQQLAEAKKNLMLKMRTKKSRFRLAIIKQPMHEATDTRRIGKLGELHELEQRHDHLAKTLEDFGHEESGIRERESGDHRAAYLSRLRDQPARARAGPLRYHQTAPG